MMRAFGPAFFVIGIVCGVVFAIVRNHLRSQQTAPAIDAPAIQPMSVPASGAPSAAELIKLVPNSDRNSGELAADFNLLNADGRHVSLSGYRGKIVMVNFWATWCPTCQSELPSLQALWHDYRNRDDFELVTISVDQEGWRIVAPFLDRTKYDFPVLADADSRVSVAYGVRVLPTTFIIDRDGRIVWDVAGALDWSNQTLRAALDKLFPAA